MREYLIDSDFEPEFLFKCVYSQLQKCHFSFTARLCAFSTVRTRCETAI